MRRPFASVGIRREDVPQHRRVLFIKKVAVAHDEECWEWQGARSPDGYGIFQLGSGFGGTTAQRAAYAIFVGDLAPGLTIDHRCRNRGCVNPRHLEAVPHGVNVRRGGNARRTHCKNGHPLELYVGPTSKQRYCPVCKRDNGRLWMRHHRAQQKESA